MKSVWFMIPGLADELLDELDGETPLSVAQTPSLDRIVEKGKIGLADLVPDPMHATPELSLLSALGYSPRDYMPGRACMDLSAREHRVSSDEIVFCVSFITHLDGSGQEEKVGNIQSAEMDELLKGLSEEFKSKGLKFVLGPDNVHLMITKMRSELRDLHSQDLLPVAYLFNSSMDKMLPSGEAGSWIKGILNDAHRYLMEHEINKVRIDLGENPANHIWLWGQSQNAKLPYFEDMHQIKAAMCSTEHFVKGLSSMIQLDFCGLKKVNSLKDRYEKYFKDMTNALKQNENVFFHIVDADAASIEGDYRLKIRIIEALDRYLLGPTLENYKQGLRFMVSSNHCVSTKNKEYISSPSPFAVCGEGVESNEVNTFNESTASKPKTILQSGKSLLKEVIQTV